jgi:hypothetical protein
MQTLNAALGKAVVDGGLAMIEADSALYGEPTSVMLAQAKTFEFVDAMAQKAGADVFRRLAAHRMGDLLVAIIHGGDLSTILQRSIAEIGRIAPLPALAERRAARETLDGMANHGMAPAREPAPSTVGAPPTTASLTEGTWPPGAVAGGI